MGDGWLTCGSGGQRRDGERGAGERADRWARGDAGACAGRAGWAAARSWRVSRSAGRTGPSGAAWPRWAAAGQAGVERAGQGLGPRGGELGRPGEREREEEADRAGLGSGP